MNADAFRHFYEYHFAENRKIWDYVTHLTYEQFTLHTAYSRGSVRDQIAHLIDADEMWFSELRNVQPAEPLPDTGVDDRTIIRSHWDHVEQRMREYLSQLQDDMLLKTPIQEPDEDKELVLWQVLLHVANHGTDHRAQILRLLNDLGIETIYQDYIFYVYGHP